ncbi:hypothetical protein OF83DRAFT_844571 [Amylostereum chailletii]|nr:hypothetical protein OF83DRAFT_844571 [Amylostereum chailletii]
MHFFDRKKKDAVPSRLHSSPSLPNLLNRPTPAQRSPTALRSHLGPLDLAPSKLHPSATPPASPLHLSSLSLSPASSPRRNVLPLTPPLTPSSSLDGGLGLPATPVDEPRSRAVVRDKQGRLVVSLDEDLLREDGFLDDIPTPKERPYEAFYRSKSRAPVENSAPEGTSIVHYIDRDTPPSRFLLIANLPESRSALDHLLGEKTHSLVKGLWAGQLSTCGVVILAFFDVRAAERARYLWNGSDFLETENDGRRGESRRTLRAGWVSLSEAKDLTGNTYPSPITEIEEEAAFYVHLQDFVPGEGTDGGSRDMASRRERVESLMNSFGALLAFTSCGQADSGEVRWISLISLISHISPFLGLLAALHDAFVA